MVRLALERKPNADAKRVARNEDEHRELAADRGRIIKSLEPIIIGEGTSWR